MAKRGASSELNHDNWDQEEEPEKQGVFQLASNDVLQKRVIKVAKRRSAGLTDQGSPNVFSSFSGFKRSNSKATSNPSSPFSILKNIVSSPLSNGVKISPNTAVSSSTNNISSGDQNLKMSDLNKGNCGLDKYPAKLIRLNQCVAEWIKTHVDKDPSCILTPIFKDYESYLKEIEEERLRNSSNKVVVKDTTTSMGTNQISSSNTSGSSFKFNQPADNSEKMDKLSSLHSVTSSNTLNTSKCIFSSFKTDNNPSSGSSLLAKPDPASLMMNPFTTSLNKPEDNSSKGGDNTALKPPDSFLKFSEGSKASSSFSFGNFNTAKKSAEDSGTGSNTDNTGDPEESDEPPKPDFKPVEEADAVYSKRCKVFIKKESNYTDLGVGTLYIKPVTGEKYQLIVRADTSLGKILVNVLLASAIPTQRMGKNNVMIICVPTPPIDSKTQPTPSTVLLRVKTADEADELYEQLENYKKQNS